MKSLFSPSRTTSPSGSSNTLRGMEVRILSVGTDYRPDRDVRWGGRRYGLPPLGTHDAMLVAGVAGGLRSKRAWSLSERYDATWINR